MKLKLSKCHFFKEETKYLGFIINGKGIKPDLDKVEVIREIPDTKKNSKVDKKLHRSH